VRAELCFVGLNVKRFRKQKHWTQEETAKREDISRIALIHIESGRAIPTLETISNLCRVLEVSLPSKLRNYSDSAKSLEKVEQLEALTLTCSRSGCERVRPIKCVPFAVL
jgi:transcriptional regulator with XRE-family HTH domain